MTAPARAIAMRTQAGAEQAVDHGERPYLRHRLGHLPRSPRQPDHSASRHGTPRTGRHNGAGDHQRKPGRSIGNHTHTPKNGRNGHFRGDALPPSSNANPSNSIARPARAESMNQTRSEPSEPQPIGREDTASDLRSWARGALATEAAVELLIGLAMDASWRWHWLPSDSTRPRSPPALVDCRPAARARHRIT
jgi:hypothetical protein